MTLRHFPVVVQHMEACGVLGQQRVSSSIIPAASVLLLSRGADRLIIPVPHSDEAERAEAGVELLPAERRGMVKLVDGGGDILRRVRDYLEPLSKQAVRWPENAFVGFCEDFLYELVVAERHHAGIVSDAASIVRDFVPIVDPTAFSGEAGFRMAELFRLVCDYQPAIVQQGVCHAEISTGSSNRGWELLDAAEFRALTIESGRIGYLKKPLVGLRRLRERFLAVIRNPRAKMALSLATTAADAAGAGGVGKRLGDLVERHSQRSDFRPPFLSLGPAALPLYEAALRRAHPGATPPQGVAMLFETLRKGKATHSWLNDGERDKLEREAEQGLEPRLKKHREALVIVGRLISG